MLMILCNEHFCFKYILKQKGLFHHFAKYLKKLSSNINSTLQILQTCKHSLYECTQLHKPENVGLCFLHQISTLNLFRIKYSDFPCSPYFVRATPHKKKHPEEAPVAQHKCSVLCSSGELTYCSDWHCSISLKVTQALREKKGQNADMMRCAFFTTSSCKAGDPQPNAPLPHSE